MYTGYVFTLFALKNYSVIQYILLCEHSILSAKYVLKDFCTFLSAKTLVAYFGDSLNILDNNIYCKAEVPYLYEFLTH